MDRLQTILEIISKISDTKELSDLLIAMTDRTDYIPCSLAKHLDPNEHSIFYNRVYKKIVRQLFIYLGKPKGPRSVDRLYIVQPDFLTQLDLTDNTCCIIIDNLINITNRCKPRSELAKEGRYVILPLADQIKTIAINGLQKNTDQSETPDIPFHWTSALHLNSPYPEEDTYGDDFGITEKAGKIIAKWLEIRHIIVGDLKSSYLSLQYLNTVQPKIYKYIFANSSPDAMLILNSINNEEHIDDDWLERHQCDRLMPESEWPKSNRLNDCISCMDKHGLARKNTSGRWVFRGKVLKKIFAAGGKFRGKRGAVTLELPEGLDLNAIITISDS